MSVKVVMETIGKYWLQWSMGLIGAGLVALWRKVSGQRKEMVIKDKAMEDALRALLRDRILHSCRSYLAQGQISMTDLEVLKGMFEAYSALGGNGVIHELYNRTAKLKIIVEVT